MLIMNITHVREKINIIFHKETSTNVKHFDLFTIGAALKGNKNIASEICATF